MLNVSNDFSFNVCALTMLVAVLEYLIYDFLAES
jgi:hypothetical protein